MSKLVITSFFLLFFCNGCKNSNRKHEISNNENYSKDSIKVVSVVKVDSNNSLHDILQKTTNYSNLIPDTSVNNKLKLESYESSETFYPNYRNLKIIDTLRNNLVVFFSDKFQKQYLLGYVYEGDTKNAFACFEIGFIEDDTKLKNSKYNLTDEKGFKTESGLKLGMSLNELVKKKGKNYEIRFDVDSTLVYKLNTNTESSFLTRYNMPGYFMEFKIKNNKVRKILFGFDYP
jgi:hypothetical protein